MKKILLLLILNLLYFLASAQTNNSTNAGDKIEINALLAQDYLGKYKVKESFITEIVVKYEQGKLLGEVVGQGIVELATTNQPDIFEIADYGARVEFVREFNKIIKAKLIVQGTTIEAEREQ